MPANHGAQPGLLHWMTHCDSVLKSPFASGTISSLRNAPVRGATLGMFH